MSISSSVPSALSKSPRSAQQLDPTDIPSAYNFPQELDLTDPQVCQPDWGGYRITDDNNDHAADPLQRLASTEPEQLPWSGIHLNGVPPSQPQKEQLQVSSSNSMNGRIDQQRSSIGSHANETDEGYYTHSQLDLRSIYSGDSGQVHQMQPGQSSIPRTISSTEAQSAFAPYNANQFVRTTDYQGTDSIEQQILPQVQQEPLLCEERGCSFSCKTMSDLKYVVLRHDTLGR